MRLGNKVLLALGVLWVLFLLLFYISAHQFFIKSFLNLESSEINKNIYRVHQAIDQVSYALGTFTIDWAHWNDAYDFIDGNHSSFVSDNLDITAFNNSNINLLIYLNKKGKILIGTATNGKQFVAYPKGLDKYIYPGSVLQNHRNPESNIRGMIALPSGIMLIAAAGTSYTDLSKPINGTLIAGRFFTNELLRTISLATQINLTLYLTPQILQNSELKNIYEQALQSADNNKIILPDNKWADAYTLLKDIYNYPIGMIKLKIPRTIYLSGTATIDYYIGVFIISGMLLGFLIWYLLRILVLNRLEYLNNSIKKISLEQNIKQPSIPRGDELTSLAVQFNNMMQTIQSSYEHMKQNIIDLSKSEKNLEFTNKKLINEINQHKQSDEKVAELHDKLLLSARYSGMRDITKGVLHSVKNTINSVVNSIILIKDKIEDAQSKNIRLIKTIIETYKTNNLTEKNETTKMIDTLSKRLDSDNQTILNEIMNLETNVNHMKEMIKMQKSLNKIDMLEEVSPKRLISDTILLCKTRIDKANIEVITNYEFKGKLIIDRVKALYVIVSLMRNSIDALKVGNAEHRKIIITVKKQDETKIIINVEDNGIGIPAEYIGKVFNFDFTTKGKGHGYALNASNALVHDMLGSLSVFSSGLNQGATFTLILPIQAVKDSELKKMHITRERT